MTLHFSDQEFQSAAPADIGSSTSSVASLDLRRPKPSWQNEIVSTLCRYLELPEGWDTYGGKPLRHETGMFALQVLNGMMGPSIPSPQIVPVGDGGLQVEWHQNGLDIELYIAAPYDCELLVHDHYSEESKVTPLTSDFTSFSAALAILVDYNRHLSPIAHAG